MVQQLQQLKKKSSTIVSGIVRQQTTPLAQLA
jgi:hypothetical protein